MAQGHKNLSAVQAMTPITLWDEAERQKAVDRLREIEGEIENLLQEAQVLMRIVAPDQGAWERLKTRWAALLLVL